MSEEMTPRRRRVRQVVPQEMLEEETPAAKLPEETAPQSAPAQEEAPRRIVIAHEDDEPDWMVSAGKVTGAAQRRTGYAAAGEEAKAAPAAEANGAKESEIAAINRLKKGAAAAAPVADTVKTTHTVKTAKTARPVRAKKPAAKAVAARKAAASTSDVQRTAKAPAPKKKLTKKARARRAKKIRKMVIAALVLAIVIGLIVGGSISLGRLVDIKKTLDRGDGVFYPNIFVNNIPLEGRTLDEAAAVVTQQVNSLISSWRITLRAQDGRTWDITGQDLKMSYDVADQLDQLWAIGHTGPSAQRYEQVKALEEGPVMRYTTLTYDMSAINQILTQIKGEVDRAPVSATKVYDETRWPPYSYTDDVPGQELDITGLSERIMGMVDTLESGVVDLSPTPVEAPITRAYLESQIVQLATYETSISKAGDYAEARAENIRIGTEKFDKLIIRSGEQVSFNKVTGLRSLANGFVTALELAYGEYVEGVGGGICQVSSTLYNAVVGAGLEVKQRTQHSLPSSYVEKGLDATVQDNRLDFVFKNSTSSDIFIDGEFYKGKNSYYRCRFTIWGRPDPSGNSYKLVSEVKETIPIPEMVYRKDKDMKYVVYDDEEYQTSKGQEGYIVDVYRVTVDKNGNEVSREKAYTDTYKAVAPVTYVGITPRPTPEPEPTPEFSID